MIESESIKRTNKDLFFEAMRSGDYSLLLEMSTDIPKAPGVYGIFNKELKKVYIGSSTNVSGRISTHLSNLRCGNHLCAEMNLHFLESSDSFTYFLIDGMDREHLGEKNKNLLVFEAKTMLSTPKEALYNNLIPILSSGEGEFNTDTVVKIPVSEICARIDMTADAVRANGLSFSDYMTIDAAIEFVRKRTVAAGRWTKEKAEKSILYMAELETIKSESSIQINWEARPWHEKDPMREQVASLYDEMYPDEKLKRAAPVRITAGKSPASNEVPVILAAINPWRKHALVAALIIPTLASVTNTFNVSHAMSSSQSTAALITGVASATSLLFLWAGVRGVGAWFVVAATLGFEAFCNACAVFTALMGTMAYSLTTVSGVPSHFLDMVATFTGKDHQDVATVIAYFTAAMICGAQVSSIYELKK